MKNIAQGTPRSQAEIWKWFGPRHVNVKIKPHGAAHTHVVDATMSFRRVPVSEGWQSTRGLITLEVPQIAMKVFDIPTNWFFV